MKQQLNLKEKLVLLVPVLISIVYLVAYVLDNELS